ncbi:MAG: hypothetical protein CFE44_11560 [Burkholderiales bacterium PBB4]|nr:MAG: hypothetical protein CFE44_11560 [Burkholderiales bacterium PBB4]
MESKSAAELRTASRINNAILLELLGLAAPARLQDGLKAIQREEGSAAVSDIRFTVDRSDPRVLALSVAAQGCGAYCEPFTLAFVFDALSGRRVQANDLFSPQGARSVAQLLARQRVTCIKNEVARLRNLANPESKAGKKLSDGERESHLEAAGMFEACIPQYADTAQGQNPMHLEAMQLTGTSVVFTRGRCSIHAMQALDDLGEFKNPLLIQDLSLHLSPYGRYLVAAGPAAPPPASPFGQVLFAFWITQ